MGNIAILINAELHNELVLRTGKNADVSAIIEAQLENFLERTKYDEQWCDHYRENLETLEEDLWQKTYGRPEQGYYWQNVFLPNGVKLKMTYKGRDHFAEIKHKELVHEGERLSPSEFARRVANNTNRNAWRDVWVLFPNEKSWQFADALRRRNKSTATGSL